jgi:glycosyltransferase involved in cell wall biosynthesis
MPYRTPSRYLPAGGPLFRIWSRVAETGGKRLSQLAGALFEGAVFGRVPGIAVRPLVTRIARPHLLAIEAAFDPGFYLRQFSDRRRRARVERAPLLHYALIGWRERRPPAPIFDPAFYRRRNPELGQLVDPLLHYMNVDAVRAVPRNEAEQQLARRFWREDQETVLSIHHGRGGGSSRFLDLYEQHIWQKGGNILRLRAVAGAPTLAVVEDKAMANGVDASATVFDLALGRHELAEFARKRRVVRLLVNHLIDRPPEAIDWVRDLSAAIGCPYDVVLHDYYALCPRVDMVTGDGRFCDTAPTDVCVECVAAHGSEVSNVDPRVWRRDALAFLAQADRIVVPSEDLATRMRRHLAKQFDVWPPEDDLDLPSECTPRLAAGDPLRIIMLGSLNVSKGARVVQALAHAAKASATPLAFTVLGPSPETAFLEKAGVAVTGAYRPESIDRLIEDAAPHVVFLPAVWPETWSFVLTAALRRGLPVVAFELGAPAERLRRLGRGRLLPLELSGRPDDLLAIFRGLREQWIVR